jgi:hypothetical protein
MLLSHAFFRWVWLNRGDGSARTRIELVKVEKLLDELWAEAGMT